MKKIVALLLAAAMAMSLAACGGGDDSQNASDGDKAGSGAESGSDKEEGSGEPYKVAYLVNGNLGDKSFYDSANEGLVKLQEELGKDAFEFKVEEMGGSVADESSWEPTLLDYCDTKEYDMIVVGTWQMYDALTHAAEQYPEQKFIFFDEPYDFEASGNKENIFNVLFKQNEVSYLVGAAAAMLTTDSSLTGIDASNKVIGFLGGMDGVVINDFLVGYIQGSQDIEPEIQVAVAYIGDYLDSAKGKELALTQYQNGVDVGFNVAGVAGLGQIEAAADVKKYAFGVDSDQAALLPDYADYIPTSALKNVGNALYLAIKEDMDGKLAYGTTKSYGFAEGGVGIVKDAHYEALVPESIRTRLDEIEAGIIDGSIQVKTAYDMTTDEIEQMKASVKVQ